MKYVLVMLMFSLFLTGCGNGGDNGDGNEKNPSSQADSQGGNTIQQGSRTQSNSGNIAKEAAGNENGFKSERARKSYALGMNIGNALEKMPVDVDMDPLIAGMKDQLGPGETRLTEQQFRQEMLEIMQQIRAERQEKNKQKTADNGGQSEAAANLEQARKFLARNKQKPGVKTTGSGLQYKVIEKGDGPVPDRNDVVTVSYVGKLPSGKVFDSTQPGETATFPVKGVIPGWTEALQMMHEGAKYKLFIPPDLAYGQRGAGKLIGPNQVLVFSVTLKNVKPVKGSS